MHPQPFNRTQHLYKNEAFAELVKDAVRFFNGTPVHVLPPPEAFAGTGVYALYYTGVHPLYARYAALNRLAYQYPIYVGNAVPVLLAEKIGVQLAAKITTPTRLTGRI